MSMSEIHFGQTLFRLPRCTPESEIALGIYLAALHALDVNWLQARLRLRDQPIPRLYSSGVVYKVEPLVYGPNGELLRRERWQTISDCLEIGEADCEDLACWLAAEKNVLDGIDARPVFTKQVTSSGLVYHIVVRYFDGTTEDPSRVLGMGR